MEALFVSKIKTSVYFYNPNIHPIEEYEIRKDENKRFCDKLGFEFIDADPIIGLVAAGSPTLATENIEKFVNCSKSIFNKKFDYFLRVKGLSMKDAGIMEDDLIAVHKTSEVRNGDIVIARYDDEVTVKFFEKLSDKKIRLIPANSDFKNLEINLEETELHIEGKSVGLIREN